MVQMLNARIFITNEHRPLSSTNTIPMLGYVTTSFKFSFTKNKQQHFLLFLRHDYAKLCFPFLHCFPSSSIYSYSRSDGQFQN